MGVGAPGWLGGSDYTCGQDLESLPNAAESWVTSALLVARPASRGLSFPRQGSFRFVLHLLGKQQCIKGTQDRCREAQDLSVTTRVGRKGQITLQAQLHLSFLFLSHKADQKLQTPPPRTPLPASFLAAVDQVSLSKRREAVGFAAHTGLNLTSY